MNQSSEVMQTTGKLAAALAEARKAFKPIVRSKTVTVKTQGGSAYSFSYAPFEDIVAATEESLAENGLTVIQSAGDGSLVSTLYHSSGEYVASSVPLLLPDKARPQEVGSALTYARRYGYTLLLCLAADDDDDANIAEGNEATVTKQRKPEDNRSAVDDAAERWWKKSVLLIHAWAKNNKRWGDLGMEEGTVDSLTERGHVGDIARNNLMQKAIGKAPSTPPTTAEYNTASAWLTDLREGAFKVE